MVRQDFIGALDQFWTVEDKPRLDRRNTWFDDNQINPSLLIMMCYVSVPVVILFVAIVMVMGVI